MRVLINGTEYPALRDYHIEEQAGNKTSTSVSVEVDEQPFPVAGDIIEIYDFEPYSLFETSDEYIFCTSDGDEFWLRSDRTTEMCIFYGMCGIPKSPKYQTLHEKRIYSIVCGNANSILSNRVINEAFQNYTVSDIVQALFDGYISEENITLDAISDIDVTMDVYTAKDRNLQEALNELADLVGATWTITPSRKFRFLAETDFPVFPETISEDFLLGTDLQHTCRDYKTRTVQIISGATDTTAEQTEVFRYDGNNPTFTTIFPLAARPTIIAGGIALPSNRIGVRGIDDDKPNIAFYYSYNSDSVTYNTESGLLYTNDIVTISYIGIFPIRIVRSNEQAINDIALRTGTSGKREQVYIDKTLSSRADAQQLADSLLERFSEQSEEVSFWLLSSELEAKGLAISDTELLTAVNFDLPTVGIEGKYVITARIIEPYDADLTDSKKITLKLTNRDYLKSHGETIASLRRGIAQLSIREDEIVISESRIEEETSLTETNDITCMNVITRYPTNTVTDTGLFVPFSFGADVYPYE